MALALADLFLSIESQMGYTKGPSTIREGKIMATYKVEYTDTFGGEANYSWVKRETIESENEKKAVLMRKAKAALGLTGLRGKSEEFGHMIRFKPYGMSTVLFISWES